MAIIKGNSSIKKEKIKAVISAEVFANIIHYCQWAGIEDIDFFIEEAACFVFSKDKDWKEYQRSIKQKNKLNAVETA